MRVLVNHRRLQTHETERVFATVLVEDIVGSTQQAVQLGDLQWKERLNRHDTTTSRIVARFQGQIVKTTSDGTVATFVSPSRALRCAERLRAELDELRLQVRIGVHAGEIERRGDDIAGVGVHIAARICDCAPPGGILVSRTVCDLVVGSDLQFKDQGTHQLRGVPGTWDLLALTQLSPD